MNTLTMIYVWIRVKFAKFIHDEKGVSAIVATVVLVGIAVVLAILFKDAIGDLITEMLNKIKTQGNETLETLAPIP